MTSDPSPSKVKDMLKRFEELAHAYFEPGDKTYWDAIEFAQSFFESELSQIHEEIHKLKTKEEEV